MGTDYLHGEITDLIIKAFYKVYNTLGYGFLEKVYENAMRLELESLGLSVKTQQSIKIYYEGNEIGYYVSDMLVNDLVIVENKTSSSISSENQDQLLNYLKATEVEVGLLLNFGKKPEFILKIFENKYK